MPSFPIRGIGFNVAPDIIVRAQADIAETHFFVNFVLVVGRLIEEVRQITAGVPVIQPGAENDIPRQLVQNAGIEIDPVVGHHHRLAQFLQDVMNENHMFGIDPAFVLI